MFLKSLKISNPLVLALAVILVSAGSMLAIRLVWHNGLVPWRIVGMAMLFYAAASQLSGLFVRGWIKYVLVSLVCFVAVIASLVTVARLLSDVPLQQLFYMKTVYVLAVVFYVLLNGLAGVFRIIYDMVKPEEDH